MTLKSKETYKLHTVTALDHKNAIALLVLQHGVGTEKLIEVSHTVDNAKRRGFFLVGTKKVHVNQTVYFGSLGTIVVTNGPSMEVGEDDFDTETPSGSYSQNDAVFASEPAFENVN